MHAPAATATAAEFGPWNPGIVSELPPQLLPLSTIFRPENAFTPAAHAQELAELTGLPLEDLTVFRPERLVLHELLIRVTADLSVPDGSKIEDLGISFRRMTDAILKRHVAPQLPRIVEAYQALRAALAAFVGERLSELYPPPPGEGGAGSGRPRGWLAALFRRAAPSAPAVEEDWAREERVLRGWSDQLHGDADALRRAGFRALLRTVSAVRSRHGGLWGDRALLAEVATGMACNDHGAEAIGALLDPLLIAAADAEGYHRLPAQARPVVMNTKGASASGKSTMRPLQKRLAGEIGARWSDFALISPDIWRKYLLDYASLGAEYRYAGTFTGKEIAIIDQKLDRYMARKAERGAMSHLLIDRFRFDSFASDSEEAGSNLLTRFGDLVYMFFMVTPPHETVERSWRRGLEVGRYKAVDDLLAHNVEAYTGMPRLFFTWTLRPGKAVHCEFLDNTVALGERPRTIAFGWNGEMNVLDVGALTDIDRYRRINVDAKSPDEVYAGADVPRGAADAPFLVECARMLPRIQFADAATGRIYLKLAAGRPAWIDAPELARALADERTRAGLLAVIPDLPARAERAAAEPGVAPDYIPAERYHTLGSWGERAPLAPRASATGA
jgi:hypothetical protein